MITAFRKLAIEVFASDMDVNIRLGACYDDTFLTKIKTIHHVNLTDVNSAKLDIGLMSLLLSITIKVVKQYLTPEELDYLYQILLYKIIHWHLKDEEKDDYDIQFKQWIDLFQDNVGMFLDENTFIEEGLSLYQGFGYMYQFIGVPNELLSELAKEVGDRFIGYDNISHLEKYLNMTKEEFEKELVRVGYYN